MTTHFVSSGIYLQQATNKILGPSVHGHESSSSDEDRAQRRTSSGGGALAAGSPANGHLFDSKRPKVSGKTSGNDELVGNEHRTIKLQAVQQTPDVQSSKEAAAEQSAAGCCLSQHLKQKDADISILRQQVMFLETKMEQENEQAHKAIDFLKETGGLESQYPALTQRIFSPRCMRP